MRSLPGFSAMPDTDNLPADLGLLCWHLTPRPPPLYLYEPRRKLHKVVHYSEYKDALPDLLEHAEPHFVSGEGAGGVQMSSRANGEGKD
jgi:hypothetical protein